MVVYMVVRRAWEAIGKDGMLYTVTLTDYVDDDYASLDVRGEKEDILCILDCLIKHIIYGEFQSRYL